MNPILLNFVHIIRRFKMATTLNILGLSVAFAAFMIIMIQLDYDFGFDKFHKDSDNIFRVEMSVPMFAQTNVPMLPRPFAEAFFESSPHIVVGALSNHSSALSGGRDQVFFHVETENSEKNFFKEKSVTVSPEFFELFTFDFVEGNLQNAHIEAGDIFMPLSMARKIFGHESVVGNHIIMEDGTSRTILAVYRDFPSNTIIGNSIYFLLSPDEDKNHWGFNYNAFIRVNDASNATQLVDNFMRNFDFQAVFGEGFNQEEMGLAMNLTALTDIHFLPEMQYDFAPKVSRQTLFILFAIAIVIIVIAAINFTNFSAALAPMRVKSINTQRVVGAHHSTMRLMLVFEAVAISFLAYICAIFLVLLFFHKTSLANLVDANLSLTAHWQILGGSALFALLTGFLAGLYPSRYMTSFEPALVLKGSFGLTPKGKKLRNALISIQFVASFAMIVGASFMFLQNRFMQKSYLGYNTENIIVVETERIADSRDAFANRIKAFSGVEDVTFSAFFVSSADAYSAWNVQYRGEQFAIQLFPVHYSFIDVMGIEITEGRSFRREDGDNEQGSWIFNESARKQLGLEVNTQLEGFLGGDIIGFIPDIKLASFRTAVEPTGFYLTGTQHSFLQANNTYIRLHQDANMSAALSHINATLAEFDPNFPFEIRFFDEVLQRLYEKETSISSLITLFSLLAIFVSIVGVFGLVVFDSQYRRKEIGVRKVFGATTLSIIVMFNKGYVKILLICFVIAAPLAWYAVNRWLENFAYKTPMHWWVYLLAFLAVGIITILTVTFQNWRTANEDPVKTINS